MFSFGLYPDEWGLCVLLGLVGFGLPWALGWLDWIGGLEDLLCGPPPEDGPEE